MFGRTKETFLYFDGKPDRWVRTGDEVIFNEKLEIFVVDRIKVGHMFVGHMLHSLTVGRLGNFES